MESAIGKPQIVLRALAGQLDDPNHRRLSLARFSTSFANWCFTIALGVYGFEAHGIVGVGLVALIRLLPGAFTAPLAGVLTDRHPRRAVLILSSLAMTVILAGVAIAAGLGAPAAVVFVFPGLYAIAASAYAPAESAIMPGLARTPQELSAGNVNHAAMEYAGSLFGALVTGLLLATTSPDFIFAVSAAASALVVVLLIGIDRDRRPDYLATETEIVGAAREIRLGIRTLATHPALRLAWLTMALLFFFEGFAEVILVGMALHLLHLGEGSVGFLNAAWGVGALAGGAALALLLDRGHLVAAIAGGSVVLGLATMLPGIWPEPLTAYAGWFAIGVGFVFVEVAAKTLMQRLGDDETMGRLLGFLEAGKLGAMAFGSVAAIVADELLHTRGALIALGAVMPVFVVVCWARLRSYEIGAPVAEGPYNLLRSNSIFAPLPMATVERLSHDLTPVELGPGHEVIVQGETGDRFFVIESGGVEVFENGEFRRNEGPGESFGEIALLHDVPRTATVRTTEPTRLLALDRERFLTAVTGHRRSSQLAGNLVDDRWASREVPVAAED